MQDLIAGQIDLMFDQAGGTLPQLRNGKIKVLAVSATKRLPQAPDIPTLDEAGVPGFYLSVWHGMWVPKGTPKDIIVKLIWIVAALANPAIQKKPDLGQRFAPISNAKGCARTRKAEAEKWWPIIKAANIM
jgi:tripartite-type tricarboxylate transporter receptor subunit TctC